jgi:hypothetical protein
MSSSVSRLKMTRRSVLVGGAFALLGCGKSSGSRTLRGTATFPDAVGGGPVANSRFVVVDLNRPGAPQVAQGTSEADGSWFVPEANGINVAVIFDRPDNSRRVRVSGLTRPDQTGFEKLLTGQTDIACEAGLGAVAGGGISGNQVTAALIDALEQAALGFVGRTDFRNASSVTASANQVRQIVLGFI